MTRPVQYNPLALTSLKANVDFKKKETDKNDIVFFHVEL